MTGSSSRSISLYISTWNQVARLYLRAFLITRVLRQFSSAAHSSSSHRTRQSPWCHCRPCQLLDDAVQLFVREGGQQLGNEPPQGVHGDEALPLSVVDPVVDEEEEDGKVLYIVRIKYCTCILKNTDVGLWAQNGCPITPS